VDFLVPLEPDLPMFEGNFHGPLIYRLKKPGPSAL
jgi:hypothetical protein